MSFTVHLSAMIMLFAGASTIAVLPPPPPFPPFPPSIFKPPPPPPSKKSHPISPSPAPPSPPSPPSPPLSKIPSPNKSPKKNSPAKKHKKHQKHKKPPPSKTSSYPSPAHSAPSLSPPPLGRFPPPVTQGTLAIILESGPSNPQCGSPYVSKLFAALNLTYNNPTCLSVAVGIVIIVQAPISQTTSTPLNAPSILGYWATANSYCGVILMEVITKSQDPSHPDSATYYLGSSRPGYSPAVIVPQLLCADYSG
ncbi:hypothetical protein CEUSTIGMA_g7236.t1 [Chlamydomonas eustigma]|uniref:Pherophorin domain-containing protein n=1 Tax=Chlamydomonas eustigma TaxID=1157962 RepID=A0A250X9S3_9CHLO|nr:hypothetical protein CEUSTIGMA_g7236.t1 [Chlamydomonas eustigma]|eukprot:GAX79796.1 hypothetical protein CEUSTIGMA_g7236.t1 [Chlamydomonas eustigma]